MKLEILKRMVLFSIFIIAASCAKEDEQIDTEKPVINVSYDNAFPKSCAVLKRGNTYIFRALATDNTGIASYGVDIHHNFDQHTHDDQPGVCPLDPKKTAVKPMIYMQNFAVPDTGTSYEIYREISIPQDIDPGDYHCQISVIDKTGWQSRTSVDIKIIE